MPGRKASVAGLWVEDMDRHKTCGGQHDYQEGSEGREQGDWRVKECGWVAG